MKLRNKSNRDILVKCDHVVQSKNGRRIVPKAEVLVEAGATKEQKISQAERDTVIVDDAQRDGYNSYVFHSIYADVVRDEWDSEQIVMKYEKGNTYFWHPAPVLYVVPDAVMRRRPSELDREDGRSERAGHFRRASKHVIMRKVDEESLDVAADTLCQTVMDILNAASGVPQSVFKLLSASFKSGTTDENIQETVLHDGETLVVMNFRKEVVQYDFGWAVLGKATKYRMSISGEFYVIQSEAQDRDAKRELKAMQHQNVRAIIRSLGFDNQA